MKKIFIILLILHIFTSTVLAEEICDDRYLTLVNPVRDRSLWLDKTIDPLKKQYSLIKQHNFSSTWLLQYDVLKDRDLLEEIKNFDSSQEIGVFLEVSQKQADRSRAIYPYDSPWFSPKAVFLSGYSQSDRRKLIDKLFKDFKKEFKFPPKSVGAWWIDSYSLNYLKDKYHIRAAMIVADQKTTDNYGVWGQWWGVPYYPAKANILTPASSLENKQDVVILQWAQRDPVLAIGEGTKFSNYSLQANDYIRQGKNTDYFQKLLNVYLDCQNPLGQVTIGLETGSESVMYFEEYGKQLQVLKSIPNIQPVTMNEFYDKFSQVYQENPKEIVIENGNFKWVMNTEKRVNNSTHEVIKYNPKISFDDYFVAKKDEFLNRILPAETKESSFNTIVSPGLVILLILGIYSCFKNKFYIWLITTSFTLAAFGLILRSGPEFGWWVYYGPIIQPLDLYQAVLPVVSFLIILLLNRFSSLNLWLLPLSFAFDPIIQNFRASFISGKYYFGFSLDALRFLGWSLTKDFQLSFINADFPSFLAGGLLKFDYSIIWQDLALALLFYPLAHILLAIVLNCCLKKPFKFRSLVFSIMTLFLVVHLWRIFNADPFAVQ